MAPSLAEIRKEYPADTSEEQRVQEELLFYLQSDINRRQRQYVIRDSENEVSSLYLTPEAAKSIKWETLIPGNTVRCIALTISSGGFSGGFIADNNSAVINAPLHSLSEEERKIFGSFKPDPVRKLTLRDVMNLAESQLVTEEINVKVKKKITESSAYGQNKFCKIKLLDATGRMTFQVYQADKSNMTVVNAFEEENWYKIKNFLLDAKTGAEPFLKNDRGVTVIEKLSTGEIKKQPTIPSGLEKGDNEFYGKIVALDKISYIQMCNYCSKASMNCKLHPHNPSEDSFNYNFVLIAYSIRGEKFEFKATQEKIAKYKEAAGATHTEEALLKAFDYLLRKPIRIYYNKTIDQRTMEVRDLLFEALELDNGGASENEPVSGGGNRGKKTKAKVASDENEDPEAKKSKK